MKRKHGGVSIGMSDKINLDFRPSTYFGPQSLPEHLIAQVKGDAVKKQLEELYKEGRFEELTNLLNSLSIDQAEIKALGSIHPMFMGGNYLPDTAANEIEVARIVIESTTFDVTCLYARFDAGKIHYRVVDEYDGDTLSGPSEMVSDKPLTLGEMTDFFLSAWSLIDVLEMNFEDDLDSALGFFSARSEFYADFHDICTERAIEAFEESSVDDE
jgi:hypothetical protein